MASSSATHAPFTSRGYNPSALGKLPDRTGGGGGGAYGGAPPPPPPPNTSSAATAGAATNPSSAAAAAAAAHQARERERLEREGPGQLAELTEEQREEINEAVRKIRKNIYMHSQTHTHTHTHTHIYIYI